MRKWACFGMIWAILGATAAAAAPAQDLTALRTLEHGLWELKPRDPKLPAKRMCVADPAALIQLQQGGAACSRFVIENLPVRATASYSCPAGGNGRTTVRVESSKLFQLESQGIANGSPFNVVYQARHVGACR